ncbi:MAG: response regulator [Candidatus Desulfatibia sp.]|uniref:ATP-binding response regulator n=1 Tax=Candidatus Desulfatibia sp. TaxID=3101189 RepID=UPI002F32720D
MAKAQILIVEDDGIVAMDIESRLKNFGYSISGIVNYGEKAIEKVEELNPDLVLMDIVLKGEMDGIEAAEIIRSRFGMPVVFLTAYADEERFERAKLTIPFGYILKPFQDRDLKITIEMALHTAKVNAEREQAEEALREREERFRSVVENTDAGYFFIDRDGFIQDVNESWVKMYGYSSTDEIIGKHFTIIQQVDDVERAKKFIAGIMRADPKYKTGEFSRKCKDGSIGHHIFSAKPVSHFGEVVGIEGFIIDTTERKQAEEETKKLQTQLQQAQKMESIGTLAGGIAHDFNNILFPIIGFAEMALEDTAEGSSLRNSINEILHGAKRAGDLVKQILTFSRQADQELKPLQVHLVIKEVLKLIRSSLPSTIKIKQFIKKDCGLVIADPTQIHQVAMNLMTNAYHAMEEAGGELEVTLKEIELDVEDLRDPVMTPGTYICLTVADTGIGMSKAVANRIFDPYFTTKEKGKGTGLGLAVVHGIVKSYNGDIKFYSNPGQGTAFHIYLPVIKTQAETEEIDTITPVQKGTERILLVDDEDQIVRMEKQMLQRLGYHVTERTSSIEALEAFRAAPDKFDLVITDMTMPNMTGVQLSQKLMAIRSNIPIIICTGFSEQISNEKANAWGISGYIMKPIVKRKLAEKIREVLDQD